MNVNYPKDQLEGITELRDLPISVPFTGIVGTIEGTFIRVHKTVVCLHDKDSKDSNRFWTVDIPEGRPVQCRNVKLWPGSFLVLQP